MIKKKLKRLQVQILYPAPTSSDYEPILLFEPQVSRWKRAKENRKFQTGNKYLKINIYNFHMLGLCFERTCSVWVSEVGCFLGFDP